MLEILDVSVRWLFRVGFFDLHAFGSAHWGRGNHGFMDFWLLGAGEQVDVDGATEDGLDDNQRPAF